MLDAYHTPAVYDEFLSIYTVTADPFLHEARVHLFRRDRYRHTAAEQRLSDPAAYRASITIAHREKASDRETDIHRRPRSETS